MSSVASPVLQQYSTLSHKRHDFTKTVAEYKMCVLIFSSHCSETLRILKRTERDMIKYVYIVSCKVP